MNATKKLAIFIKEKGISIRSISNATKLSESILYASLGSGRGRELRADEFLAICTFLEVDPMKFKA